MIYLTNINLNQNELQNAIIQPLVASPATGKLGQIYYNSATSKIMYYDGTEWKTVGVVVESSEANGKIKVDGVEMTVYTLPIATPDTLGGIRIGTGLNIDASTGTVSVSGGASVESANKLTTARTISLSGEASGSVSFDGSNDVDLAVTLVGQPTKLSEFENDEGFIKSTVDNLQNYYKKTETYTKTEVTTLIGNLKTIELQVVNTLPTTGQSNVIYLKKNTGSGNNSYDEYLWITDTEGSRFELIGTTEVDLSTYLTKTGDASKTTVTPATQTTAPASGSSLDKYIGYVKGKVDGLATVASTGKYTDLTDRPRETKVVTGSIAAGSLTATLNPGNAAATLISYFAIDATTNEQIMCDVKTVSATKAVTFTIAAAYSHAINLTATYSVPAV